MPKTTTESPACARDLGAWFFKNRTSANQDVCAGNYSALRLFRRPTLYPAELWAQIHKNKLCTTYRQNGPGVYPGLYAASMTSDSARSPRRGIAPAKALPGALLRIKNKKVSCSGTTVRLRHKEAGK
jgi:hypothetical protein